MRKVSIWLLGAIALAQVTNPVRIEAKNRGWFPKAVGECGWVDGRYGIANGSGVRRIWVLGTGHMLNLRDDDDSAPDLLDPVKSGWRPFYHVIYGEFLVCAIERHINGEMQQVRVRKVRNYIIQEPL